MALSHGELLTYRTAATDQNRALVVQGVCVTCEGERVLAAVPEPAAEGETLQAPSKADKNEKVARRWALMPNRSVSIS